MVPKVKGFRKADMRGIQEITGIDAACLESGASCDAAFTSVLREVGDLDALAPVWSSLASQTENPMRQYAWVRACAETLAPAGQLRMVVVGSKRQPTAIAPLLQRRFTGRLELLGVRELYEPSDAIYSDTSALDHLADALARLGQPLFLERVLADSPLVPALQRVFQKRGVSFTRPAPESPWIPLHEGWEDPESQLSSRRRSDLRRAIRHAEKIGPIRYELLSPTPETLPPLVENAFEIEAKSWKGNAGSALARDESLGSFYRQVAADACREGRLRMSFMRIGGRLAAMQMAVECGERYWLLKMGYDEEYSRCSPGMLLICETLRYAATRGLKSYELLGIVESWTHVWTESTRPCVSLHFYPMRLGGIADLATDAAIYAKNWVRGRLKAK